MPVLVSEKHHTSPVLGQTPQGGRVSLLAPRAPLEQQEASPVNLAGRWARVLKQWLEGVAWRQVWGAHRQRAGWVKRFLLLLSGASSLIGLGWWMMSRYSWTPSWLPIFAAAVVGTLWIQQVIEAGLLLVNWQAPRHPQRFSCLHERAVIAPDRQSVEGRHRYDLFDAALCFSTIGLFQCAAVILSIREGSPGWALAATIITEGLWLGWVLGAAQGWWFITLPNWRWMGRHDIDLWTLRQEGQLPDESQAGDIPGAHALRRRRIGDELRSGVVIENGSLVFRLQPSAPARDIQIAFGLPDGAESKPAENGLQPLRVYYDDRLVLDKTASATVPGWNDHDRLGEEAPSAVSQVRYETSGGERVAWAVPRVARRNADPKRVIVIVLDGVRQDMIGLYTRRKDQTPFIDRFFSDAARYTQAFSQGDWTKSAFASMATGHYPSHHRVTDRWYDGQQLPQSMPLMSEALKRQGFFTCAVMSHFLASQHFGHARGYDQFVCRNGQQWSGHTYRDVNARAIQALEQHGDEPSFLFLHYFDVHFPFHLDTPHVLPGTSFLKKLHRDIWEYVDSEGDDQRKYFEVLYANKLRELDLGLSQLFGYLEQSGLSGGTAVILTADHGVNLPTEPGMTRARKKDISISSQHVPLLIKCPWRPDLFRREVNGMVESSIDLYPSVMELAGASAVKPRFAQSLLPTEGGFWPDKRWAVSETIFGGMHQILIVDQQRQYLRRARWRQGQVTEELRSRLDGQVIAPAGAEYETWLARYRQVAQERELVQWENHDR